MMQLPEPLHFMKPGWWVLHVLAFSAVLALGVGLHIHWVEAHAGGGHHHGPGADLKPLMRTMLVDVAALQTALAESDLALATKHATSIADACDDGSATHADVPAAWGPRFADQDRALHTNAAALASTLQKGDIAAAKRHYVSVVQSCESCHRQAPAAQRVSLGQLLREPLTKEK